MVTLNVHTPSHLFSGVCGKFPPSYMGGMMAGQALGGIFPALVNIFVIAMQVTGACQTIPKISFNYQVSPEDIGFWCFLIAFIFVVLSLVRKQPLNNY